MAIKPILFNAPMVQAILEGRKTQTRQAIKKKYSNTVFDWYKNKKYGEPIFCEAEPDVPPEKLTNGMTRRKIRFFEPCIPKYKKGDVLYVRETWLKHECEGLQREDRCYDVSCDCHYVYRADYADNQLFDNGVKWKPSIHMPRKAVRIFLRVTDVRVERVQDISEQDAQSEGVDATTTPYIPGIGRTYTQGFGVLWNEINSKRGYGWDANPWVWVYTFERREKPEEWSC